MIPLINLKMLKLDMLKQNWIISSFFFTFKNTNYIVLVKLYSTNERKPKLALLKLHFMRENHFDDDLEIPANVYRLMVDPKTLRTYFKIAYSENLGDILKQFTIRLGNSIPTGVKQVVTINEKRAMVHSLSNSDAENPNKIYCYKVRRNPYRLDGKPGQRSIFNDNKTRLLRPELYQKLYRDNTLSFCYSDDPQDEKRDEDIITNWTKRHSI